MVYHGVRIKPTLPTWPVGLQDLASALLSNDSLAILFPIPFAPETLAFCLFFRNSPVACLGLIAAGPSTEKVLPPDIFGAFLSLVRS